MTRSPDSQVPSGAGQLATEKWDDKAFKCRQEGEANLWAATAVNVVSASLPPPAIKPIQLELIPGRACLCKAKPATDRKRAREGPVRRDGVEDGGTQGERILLTGETRIGPAEETPRGREAYKGETRGWRRHCLACRRSITASLLVPSVCPANLVCSHLDRSGLLLYS
jgi:hypothetical protein